MRAANRISQRYLRWPGVIVVGGGVTGLLTAMELDRCGVPVLVLEQTALCSGQTGQAHGWLHRGGIYPDAQPRDIEQLDRGSRCWAELAERNGSADALISCWIGGLQDLTRSAITVIWDKLGITHEAVDATGACGWMIKTPEMAIVPLDVLRAALAKSRVVLRRAEAVELLADNQGSNTAAVLVARVGQRLIDIGADAFVLANGAGISALVPETAAAVVSRLSFMLVVRSAAAWNRGVAIPEQEALGLLGVPRSSAQHRYLLLSNFVSYSPTADLRLSRTNWLAGIWPTVQRFLPDLWQAEDALWGIYPAVKVEPQRHVALGVADMALLQTRFANVAAGVPGKLTLAPLLAGRLADAVAPHARPQAAASGELVEQLPVAFWGPEEWEVTPLVRRSTLERAE